MNPRDSRFVAWLRGALPTWFGYESTRYLTKWLLLGTAIGVIAGVGAIVFYLALTWATAFFLGTLVGYMPPLPVGEGSPVVVPMERPVLLAPVVALGGLLSGLIVFTFAPEAEGHGTDAVIASIHHHRGKIRARIPPIKLFASAILIGSGGSGGREGPSAQISAGFSSLLADWLDLTPQDRRIAVAAGMGAGIGAIFRAPLGGAVLATEILYIHDLEVEALLPALIAAIVGYTVYGASVGFTPIFGAQPALALDAPIQLLYYVALGVLCGLMGTLYARTFYAMAELFHRFAVPPWARPALGGFVVGGMALFLPQVLGTGYGWIQLALGPDVLRMPLWILLLIPFAKILATSLSIGSGGSGGVFGPGMVIGATLGAAWWRIASELFPRVPTSPAPFVIVGMMALFGGVAHAPLSVMLMVAEMTGNLSLLAPAMIAVAVSTILVGNTTIYRSQLPNRASAPAHRVEFSFPLLSTLLVRDAMGPPPPIVVAGASCSSVERRLEAEPTLGAVVVDARGNFLGTVSREAIRRVPSELRAFTPVRAVMTTDGLRFPIDLPLDQALAQLADTQASWAPVVEDHRVVGHVHVRDIITAYQAAVQSTVRRTAALPAGTTLLVTRVASSSSLAGRTIRDISLPPNTTIVSITREGETIIPHGTTRLIAGDMVTILTTPESEETLRTFLEGTRPAA